MARGGHSPRWAAEPEKQITFDNNGFQRSMFQVTSVPVLSDLVAILFSSIVVFNSKQQFFSCTAIAFGNRYLAQFYLEL
jgi:hypothetical protein